MRATLIRVAIVALAGASWPPRRASWRQRLAALRPQRPWVFRAAEEIADSAQDQAAAAPGGRLLTLAVPSTPSVWAKLFWALRPRSRPHRRRRLLVLGAAGMSGPRGRGERSARVGDRAAALAVAEAIGHYGAARAARQLRRIGGAGAMDVLEACGSIVFPGRARFVEESRRSGCRRPTVSDQTC